MDAGNVRIFESFSDDTADDLNRSVDSGQSTDCAMDNTDYADEAAMRCNCEANMNLDLKIVKQRLHISNAERDQQIRKVNFLSKELFILEEEVLTKETEIELLQEQLKKERLGKEEAIDLLADMESYSNTEMATLRSRIDLLESQTKAIQITDDEKVLKKKELKNNETQCNTYESIIKEYEQRRDEEIHEYRTTTGRLTSQIEDLLLDKETLRDEVDFVRNEGTFLVESKQDEIQSLQQLIEQAIVTKEMSFSDDQSISIIRQPMLSSMTTDLDAAMIYSHENEGMDLSETCGYGGSNVDSDESEESDTSYDGLQDSKDSKDSNSFVETHLDDILQNVTFQPKSDVVIKNGVTPKEIPSCKESRLMVSLYRIYKYGAILRQSLISAVINYQRPSPKVSLRDIADNRAVFLHGVAFAGHLFIALVLDLPFRAVPLCCISIAMNVLLNRRLNQKGEIEVARRVDTTPIKRQKRVESNELDDMSEIDDLSKLADKEHEVVIHQQRAIDLLQYRLRKEADSKSKYKRMVVRLKRHRNTNNNCFTKDYDPIYDDYEFKTLASIVEADEVTIKCAMTQTETHLIEHSKTVTISPDITRRKTMTDYHKEALLLLLWICFTMLLHWKEGISSLAPGSLALNMFFSYVLISRQLRTKENHGPQDENSSLFLSITMILMPILTCLSCGVQMLILVEITLIIFYNKTIKIVMRIKNDLREKEAVIILMKERLILEILSRIDVKQTVKEAIASDYSLPVLCDEDLEGVRDTTVTKYSDVGVGTEHVIDDCNRMIAEAIEMTSLEVPSFHCDFASEPSQSPVKTQGDSLRKAKSMIDLRLTKWDSERDLIHCGADSETHGDKTVQTVTNDDVNKNGEDYIFMTLCWLIEQLDGFILQMKRLLQDEDSRLKESQQNNYNNNNNNNEILDIDDVKDWITQFERKREDHVMGVWKMMSEIEVIYSQILSKSAELLTLSSDTGDKQERSASPVSLSNSSSTDHLLTDRSTTQSHSYHNTSVGDNPVDLLPPGIIYNLATDFGASHWDETMLGDVISFSRSSCGFGEDFNLLSRKPEICSTQDLENSWMCLDLGIDRLVLARGYGLRHGWPSRGNAIRRWVFEASLDGNTWHVLRKHVLDTSLNEGFALMKWPLSDVFKPYRFFQVRMIGKNSSHTNELYLNALEIYGKIVEK